MQKAVWLASNMTLFRGFQKAHILIPASCSSAIFNKSHHFWLIKSKSPPPIVITASVEYWAVFGDFKVWLLPLIIQSSMPFTYNEPVVIGSNISHIRWNNGGKLRSTSLISCHQSNTMNEECWVFSFQFVYWHWWKLFISLSCRDISIFMPHA